MIGIRCGMHCQSALMARVFDAGIKLRGRSAYDDGSLVNLMLVDACRIADRFLIPFLHWGFWFSFIILFVGIFALYQMLGVACLVGYGSMVVIAPVAYKLGRKVKRAAAVIQKKRDVRSKVRSELAFEHQPTRQPVARMVAPVRRVNLVLMPSLALP